MALQKLREYFQAANSNEFNDLLKNRVLVTEKIAAPTLHVQRENTGFKYYKTGSNTPLNIVDRTIISLYEIAINHMQSLSLDKKNQLPIDWRFGFEYLPELNVSKIEYSKVPENNLILTHIQQIGENGKVKKTINDPVILNKWKNVLEVQGPSIIFDGYLNELQKTELLELLEMNDKSFGDNFDYLVETEDKTSFTKKIIKLFNPNERASILHEDLEHEIDGLIINFIDGKNTSSFKLEDFNRSKINETTSASHMYQITIADLLEYLISYDLSEIVLEEENAGNRYIELMSVIFNGYIEKNATKFVGVNFENAEFSESNSFKLNPKYITNEKTLKHIQNDVLSELFKITLSSFRKKRNKTTDIINQDMLDRMNEIIENIDTKIFVENTDENAIYDYQNFIMHNKIKSSVNLNEALKVNHTEQGKELVNMFVGRFQPFTLGHAKVLETIHKENGFPVIVFLVKSKTVKKGEEFSKPYDEATQIKMFNEVKKQYKFLKEIKIIPTGAIDTMFNELRPKYEPVLWGTGSDRLKSYGFQVNNDSYRDQLNARADFGLFEIPRTDDNISATQVRNALLDGDEKTFQQMTPKAIHGMYKELKSKLEDAVGVTAESLVIEGLMTFEQFMKKL